MNVLSFKRLTATALMPLYANHFAAGADVFADEDLVIPAGSCLAVPTGVASEFHLAGHYIRVAPRSSWAMTGIFVNAGVIDPDYKGEIKVVLHNLSGADFVINKHDKIAQLITEPYVKAVLVDAKIGKHSRGAGGFGSTDKAPEPLELDNEEPTYETETQQQEVDAAQDAPAIEPVDTEAGEPVKEAEPPKKRVVKKRRTRNPKAE